MNLFDTHNTTRNKYSFDAVLEKYIGRKKELILIEDELEKLIAKIKDGHFSIINNNLKNEITVKELNESPENVKICSLFKKFFQLKEFELVWAYTPIPNASTPCKTLQLLDKNYKVSKDGVDYNKKLSIFTTVHTGLITHSKMTAGEVLAIILHEVGHNFYQSVFQILRSFDPTLIAKEWEEGETIVSSTVGQLIGIGIADVFSIGRLVGKIKNLFNNVIDSLELRPLVISLTELTMVVSIFTPSTIKDVVRLLSGTHKLDISKINPSRVLFLYNVEKHADSFAVDYGYGKNLASAVNKLDMRDDTVVYNIPLFNWVMDFDKLMSDITFQTLSGYPTAHNRQTSALKRLKEAKSDPNLPVSLRKELDEQIKEFEEYYNNYMDIKNDENKKRIFTWLYRSFLNTVFKGNADMREFLYKLDKTHPLKDKW